MSITLLPQHQSSEFQQILHQGPWAKSLARQIAETRDFQRLTEDFVRRSLTHQHNHILLQGPPGLGKSHVVNTTLREAGMRNGVDYAILKGTCTPYSLFAALYRFRNPGQILVLDDTDTLLTDERGLQVLKAACDKSTHMVTWDSKMIPMLTDMDGSKSAVKQFEFHGTVVVCTNLSMRTGTGSRRDRNAAAVLSRLTAWDLRWETREAQFAQIFRLLTEEDYLTEFDLSTQQKLDLLSFIYEHLDVILNLDLRMPAQIAQEMVSTDAWRVTAYHIVAGGRATKQSKR